MAEHFTTPDRPVDARRAARVATGTADARRRAIRWCLDRYDYPVELETLAAHVVAGRYGIPTDAVSDADRERLGVKLHHVDIPALVAAGLVVYDPESRMAVGTAAERSERYVDHTSDARRSA